MKPIIDNDENIQRLNFESDNIIKYRKVSNNTEFCMIGVISSKMGE